MSYIEKNLLVKDEQIIKQIELHPARLVMSWIWGILFFWLLLIPLINAIKTTIYYNTTEMAVTNKNIIFKYGFLNPSSFDMDPHKVENIFVSYTFWGKIFGYGNLTIKGTNSSDLVFTGIRNPEEIRKFIIDLKG